MTPSVQAGNPYVGLRPFESKDSLYFFGRREQTAELMERLQQNRFLAVVGSSGCGKSSLIRAGLIPALLGGFLVDQRDKWLIAVMKPGDSPMRNLSVALCSAAKREGPETAAATLEKEIADDQADAVIAYLGPRLGGDTNLLLLVDQFEEIFSFRGNEDDEQLALLSPTKRRERGAQREEAANFVDLMLGLSTIEELPLYVVLTMRSDFLGDCDVFYGLPEAMNRSRYLVPRLTRQQLRESVQGPALLDGVAITPRLLDTVLNDLGGRSDQLPVLQHALLRTWNTWRQDGPGPIDLTHYEKIGGLKEALSKHAQEALRDEDLGTTVKIFQCLTDTDLNQRRIRRPAHMKELVAVSGASESTVQTIIDRFNSDGRSFLVASDAPNGDIRVDISHESLIRQWAQLRKWIDDERSSRDHYLDLLKRARGGQALLQDPDLQLALKWRDDACPSPEWAIRYSRQDGDYQLAMDYLVRSRDFAAKSLREKKRLINSIRGGVAVVVVALAGLLGWALVEKAKAKSSEERAVRAEDVAKRTREEAIKYADLTDKQWKGLRTRRVGAARVEPELPAAARPTDVTAGVRGGGTPTKVGGPVPRPDALAGTAPPPSPQSAPLPTVPTPVTLALLGSRNITFQGVLLNGQSNAIQVSPGGQFTISFQWDGRVTKKDVYCPTCIVQLYYGIDHQAGGTSRCFASDMMGLGWADKGEVKGILSAPKSKGTYYITASTTLDYSCKEAAVKQSADKKDAIAAITVE